MFSNTAQYKNAVFLGLVALFLGAVAGCGGGLELAPASGKVTLDSRPLADAAVNFVPVDGGPVASGVTDDQGRFSLATVNRPGAVPGRHRVTVTKQIVTGIAEDGTVEPGGVQIEWIVPQRYAKPDTSGLTATVGGEQQEHTFDLLAP